MKDTFTLDIGQSILIFYSFLSVLKYPIGDIVNIIGMFVVVALFFSYSSLLSQQKNTNLDWLNECHHLAQSTFMSVKCIEVDGWHKMIVQCPRFTWW